MNMSFNLVVAVLLFMGSVSGTEFPVQVQLTVRDANVTSLIAYLLQFDYYAKENENLTTKELFDVLKVNQSTSDDYSQVLTMSNISVSDITVDNVVEPLRNYLLGIYTDLKHEFGDLPVDVASILLKISKEDLDAAVTQRNETKMIQALKVGNWTKEKMPMIFDLVQFQKEHVYKFTIQEISKLPISVFLNLIRPYDSVKFLENAFQQRNVTSADFKNGTFAGILNRASASRIATPVSAKNFVTPTGVYNDQYFVIEFENKNISILNVTYNHDAGYINITTNGTGGTILQVAETYDPELKNCFYNDINVQKSLHYDGQARLLLNKGDIKFELGAPLICNKKLYGLAEDETENQLKFVTFVPKSGANESFRINLATMGVLFILYQWYIN